MIPLEHRLRDKRRELGLTQEAVAERLGVGQQTYGKWETGETRTRDKGRIEAIAAFLEISYPEALVLVHEDRARTQDLDLGVVLERLDDMNGRLSKIEHLVGADSVTGQ